MVWLRRILLLSLLFSFAQVPVAEAKKPKAKQEKKRSKKSKKVSKKKSAKKTSKTKKRSSPPKRKRSRVTPNTVSRWSNRGAMEKVDAPVQVTAPLPKRNIPKPIGVLTPGQKLQGKDEILTARMSLGGYYLSTSGQDVSFKYPVPNQPLVLGEGREISLLRWRGTMGYQNIGGTEFSARLDVAYRPRISGSRLTDQRVNELYVAWGRTDFRPGGPDLGVAFGRVAVREAGYAQADGLAVRYRFIPQLMAGLFGGVTGNPYGYNWAQRSSQIVSADWLTGGAFATYRSPFFQANLAGVVTYANPSDAQPQNADLDRFYVHLDAAYQPTQKINIFVNGFLDLLPEGQLLQNLELVGAWTPDDKFNLRIGAGRFSTVVYRVSLGYSYTVDAAGNTFGDPQVANLPIVDEAGQPIAPFDAALMTAVYNQVTVMGGYRLFRELELYLRSRLLLRDVSISQDELNQALNPNMANAQLQAQIGFSELRWLPTVGARYKNPKLIDAQASATYILDEQAQTDLVLRAGIGRKLWDFYLNADARIYLGGIGAWDGGAALSYRLPREWFVGQLSARAMFRYYQEDVALRRPSGVEQVGVLQPDQQGILIPVQESYMGFAGIQWRL